MDEQATHLFKEILRQIQILTAEHEAIISVLPKEQQDKFMAELQAICRRKGIDVGGMDARLTPHIIGHERKNYAIRENVDE